MKLRPERLMIPISGRTHNNTGLKKTNTVWLKILITNPIERYIPEIQITWEIIIKQRVDEILVTLMIIDRDIVNDIFRLQILKIILIDLR